MGKAGQNRAGSEAREQFGAKYGLTHPTGEPWSIDYSSELVLAVGKLSGPSCSSRHCLSDVHAHMPRHFSRVCLFATLWAVAHQAPLSMDSPGKNTGVGRHALLQGIFPI